VAAPPFVVVEMIDVTEDARAAGFACTVKLSQALARAIEPKHALARLHRVLVDTADDPSMSMLRAVGLRAERPPRPRTEDGWMDHRKQFVARMRAGIGGVSDSGATLALPADGRHGLVMMVCQVGAGLMRPAEPPTIMFTTVDDASLDFENIAFWLLR
jgi:hypothetical protein